MYKKILAPVDGSEFSECSLAHVKAVASGCRVPEVVLLKVIEPLPPAYETGEEWRRDVEKRVAADARDYLSQLADSLKKDGIAAEIVIAHGKADEEILDYAGKNKIDLIIMSTHGRSGIGRWVMGGVADRVVRHSMAPVLIVSPDGCRI